MPDKKWEFTNADGEKLTITIAEKTPSAQSEQSTDSEVQAYGPTKDPNGFSLDNGAGTKILTITIAE